MPPKLDKKSPTEQVHFLAPASMIARINAYRRTQPDLPNASEAIRRLVEAGLDSEKKGRKK